MSNNESRLITELQEQTSEVLVRHRSILDIMTKLDEYNARINRAIAKSVTFCGCIEIDAKKQDFHSTSLNEMLDQMDSHIVGEICPNCKDILEQEIGSYVFFLSALANTLDFSLASTIQKELDRTKTLGIYGMK
ncbi:MAG: DUF1573 domain-containing protein [Gudongella sp.]|jgi:hypothetical protein|nr:DUF1573 domain-containing protein [Gudongella sp.]